MISYLIFITFHKLQLIIKQFMNNLEKNRLYFCAKSITLAEEIDKIFSCGSPPKQSHRDDAHMMTFIDNVD